MYKLIIFDFDGTIMDTNDIIKESLNEASKKFRNSEISSDEYELILGKPLEQQMKDLSETKYEAMTEFYRQYYRANQESRTQIFEGVHDLLETLKNNDVKCGILTNKGRNGLEKGLKQYHIESYFEYYLSAQDVIRAKPNPEGIHKICAYYSVREEDTLMVGDSAHDIEAGKNAGVSTCLVSWTILNLSKLKKLNPDYIVDHPSEIGDIIKFAK
ncbi:HAD family hydrolase [Fusibacter ferrireducens]|uniref:HAD-IA family hydrolase n=1 Tax=Fusibacter ferrireducens TaxID=2785058 RepID=A0ABR9ZUE5_9FIRM|nr:HAD-IA family hydrolase [Fusibacter ferrireducens]MBF4694092.1 HAD-IA family hydrolase [Fusibacter ferrireducens]